MIRTVSVPLLSKKDFRNFLQILKREKQTFYLAELQLKTSFLLFMWRALTPLTALTHSNSFYIEKFEPRKEMNTTSFLNFTSYWMKVKEFHSPLPVISLVPSIYQKSLKIASECYQDTIECKGSLPWCGCLGESWLIVSLISVTAHWLQDTIIISIAAFSVIKQTRNGPSDCIYSLL